MILLQESKKVITVGFHLVFLILIVQGICSTNCTAGFEPASGVSSTHSQPAELACRC